MRPVGSAPQWEAEPDYTSDQYLALEEAQYLKWADEGERQDFSEGIAPMAEAFILSFNNGQADAYSNA